MTPNKFSNANLDSFQIGETKDWIFGLITREVYRALSDLFVINDSSNSRLYAQVDGTTMMKLFREEVSLHDIDFVNS